jgi:hypothetical protein
MPVLHLHFTSTVFFEGPLIVRDEPSHHDSHHPSTRQTSRTSSSTSAPGRESCDYRSRTTAAGIDRFCCGDPSESSRERDPLSIPSRSSRCRETVDRAGSIAGRNIILSRLPRSSVITAGGSCVDEMHALSLSTMPNGPVWSIVASCLLRSCLSTLLATRHADSRYARLYLDHEPPVRANGAVVWRGKA